jgi:hypothetical protein
MNMKQKPDPSILPLKVPADQDTCQSSRMLYRSVMISSDVQMIILDLRKMQGKASLGCDYLGKEQAEWLQFILQSSTATWKIICTGKSFGVCATETITKPPPQQQGLYTNSTDMETNGPTLEEIMLKSGSFEEGKGGDGGGILKGVTSLDGNDNQGGEEEGKNEENAELPPRKESLKQVSLVVPGGGERKGSRDNHHISHSHENHTNLYDDCDEIYGRSKFSLQHVLADCEIKLKEQNASESGSVNGNNEKAAPTATPGTIQDWNGKGSFHHISVQSGIIVLSGGIGSRWTFEEEMVISKVASSTSIKTSDLQNTASASASYSAPPTPTHSQPMTPQQQQTTMTKITHVTNIDDMLLPFYCSTYYNLSSPISQPFSLLNGPQSSHRGNPAFCMELSLGTITSQSQAQYEGMVRNNGDYYYLEGFDGYTYYSQYHAMNANQELIPQDNSFTFAEFYLLPDGVMKVSVFASSLPPSSPSKQGAEGEEQQNKTLLYECLCTVSHSNDDESVGSSVFLA